jgi:hypothetical protein
VRHLRTPLVLAAALMFLGGCGAGSPKSGSSALGRSFARTPRSTSQAAASIGDPPPERNGTLPASSARRQSTPSWAAPSPHAALLRYALVYTNWEATSLRSRERQLASLAVGTARLTAEQAAASHSAAAALVASHVHNRGVVLSIAPGQGVARGQWIIVTQEQTTGVGPYAGLPPTLHVTFARTELSGHGWAVSEWTPRD